LIGDLRRRSEMTADAFEMDVPVRMTERFAGERARPPRRHGVPADSEAPCHDLRNFVAENSDNQKLFWTGVLFGVAGGAAVAFALDIMDLVWTRQQRRSPSGVTQSP